MKTILKVGTLAIVVSLPSSLPVSSQEVISHRNAPLGVDLPTVQRLFPRCKLEKAVGFDNPQSKVTGMGPFTGYDPPFSDLTPADANGNILTLSWRDFYGQSHTMAVMDWGAITVVELNCGDAVNQGVTLITFDKKVMAVTKYGNDEDYPDARTLIETLASALPGHRGPLYRSFNPFGMPAVSGGQRQSVPVYVTYVDNGDLRVAIETKESYQILGARGFTGYGIAYVSLPLWETYAARVKADIAKTGANTENRKLEREQRLRDKM